MGSGQSKLTKKLFSVEDDNLILQELVHCGEFDMCEDEIWISLALMLNEKNKKNFSREDVQKRWTTALDQRMESYYGVQNLPSLTELGMRDEMSGYQKLEFYEKRFIQARAQIRARSDKKVQRQYLIKKLDNSVDRQDSVQENYSQIASDSENDDSMMTANQQCVEAVLPVSRISCKRSYNIDWSPKLPKVFKSCTAGASSIDWPGYKLPSQLFTGYSFIILLESKTDLYELVLSQLLEYLILLHGGNAIESRDELEEGDELVFIAGGRKKEDFGDIPEQIYSSDMVHWHIRAKVHMSHQTMVDHIYDAGQKNLISSNVSAILQENHAGN